MDSAKGDKKSDSSKSKGSAPLRVKLIFAALMTLVCLTIAELTVRAVIPVRNVGPTFSQYDPVYGKALKHDFSAGQICPEFRVTYTINSRGMRGPEPTADPSILFLGDSFTMGYGVDDGEEFPSLVAQNLSSLSPDEKLQVLNFGLGGSGNGRWLKFLEREADDYKPRAVVMQICSNDFGENILDGLYRYSDDTGELVELPVPAPSRMRKIQVWVEAIPLLSKSYLFNLTRQAALSISRRPKAKKSSSDAPSKPAQDTLKLTLMILGEALDLCDEKEWPVLMIAAGEFSDQRSQIAAVSELCSKRNVKFIELPSKSQRPDLYYKIDGHWMPNGHQEVAKTLLKELPALLAPDSNPGTTEKQAEQL